MADLAGDARGRRRLVRGGRWAGLAAKEGGGGEAKQGRGERAAHESSEGRASLGDLGLRGSLRDGSGEVFVVQGWEVPSGERRRCSQAQPELKKSMKEARWNVNRAHLTVGLCLVGVGLVGAWGKDREGDAAVLEVRLRRGLASTALSRREVLSRAALAQGQTAPVPSRLAALAPVLSNTWRRALAGDVEEMVRLSRLLLGSARGGSHLEPAIQPGKYDAIVLKWLRRAAYAGHPEAAVQLGAIFESGSLGTGRSGALLEASHWFASAHLCGSASGTGNWARCVELGIGVAERDVSRASGLYRAAIRRGHVPSLRRLRGLLRAHPSLRLPGDGSLLNR